MGCGASSNVVPAQEEQSQDKSNGVTANGHNDGRRNDHDDNLPTVVLPDTPAKPKPPVAFEIPLEEFEGGKQSTPPPHLQRLLVPPQPEISLPDIQEKLAEAEHRRLSILQQRAASAQKRAQRIMKAVIDIDRPEHFNEMESKHGPNSLPMPPEPGVAEDKNIT